MSSRGTFERLPYTFFVFVFFLEFLNIPSSLPSDCSSNPTTVVPSNTKYRKGVACSEGPPSLTYLSNASSSSNEQTDSGPQGGGKEPCRIQYALSHEDRLSDLSGADLTDANLHGARLQRATAVGANLTNADLGQANLSEANFQKANLEGAELTAAIFGNADLREANLLKANLRGANWSQTLLCNTTMPNGEVIDRNCN